MGHGPAVGRGAVVNGPQSSARKQHQHTPLKLLLSLYALLVKVNGSPLYFTISVGHEQKKVEKPCSGGMPRRDQLRSST